MERTLVRETPTLIGQTITLKGWVNTVRGHGKIAFVDIRDRSGIAQVVGDKELGKVSCEDVIEVTGTVKQRPDHLVNPTMATGTIEIEATEWKVVNHSQALPIPIDTSGSEIDESVRLKYRYIDLRRERLQKNIRLRASFVQAVREYLINREFVEIETPLLTKSTPEGSRDFLVASRLQKGKFYALPQSPQQYKQLLMTAGFERYFQLARAVRDEDLRADRGFEHTQIDIEASFVTQEDIMHLVEGMVIESVEKLGGTIAEKPFPVFSYKKAMEQFGADKFDLRTEEQKQNNQLAFAWVINFPFFEKDGEGNWTYTHNPFSHPHPDNVADVLEKKNIESIMTMQYDLVCNGFEVGGGSIRAHKPEILKAVFEIIGQSGEQIENQFGHMLKAFTLGTPPHGGIALGVERMIMILTGEKYIREVQAFPQTASGTSSVMDAPSVVDNAQLEELGLTLKNDKTQNQSTPYQKLINLLKSKKVIFEEYEHEPVHTSQDAAKVRGTSLQQGAKALVMIADKKPVLLVVSASTKVDFKAFKKAANIKDIKMATVEEALAITGIPVGAIHPFGVIYDIPTYVDEALSRNEIISFNAGLHTKSIKLKYTDYLQIVAPTVLQFAI